jgi:hypothetical protein
LLDWLAWPANLLLSAGAVVASWFVTEDAPTVVIEMMVAMLVLAAGVSMIVCWQSLVEYWRSRRKARE